MDAVAKAVRENTEAALGFLEELIRIPSISGEGEEVIQSFIAEKFQPFGKVELPGIPHDLKKDPEYTFAVKELAYARRKNLVLHFPAGGNGRSLILNSHSDTIPAPNWPTAFSPLREGDFMVGRGACDAKGHVATMYLVLLALKQLGWQPAGNLMFQVAIEEEVGGNGTLSLLRQGYKADGVIVLEPTELAITPANRGAIWFRLEIEGKSVHMGKIYEGVNAIEKTCLVLKALKEYEKKLVAESKDCLLFKKYRQPVQVNFGTIRAEGWPSMVCGKTVLEGGVGFLPNKSLAQIKQELDEAIRNCGDAWVSGHYRLDFPKLHNDAYAIPTDHPLVKSLEKAASASGLTPEVTGFIVSCDARLFHTVGRMPVVVFGAGTVGDAHSDTERIDVTQIEKAGEILVRTITDWCGGKS